MTLVKHLRMSRIISLDTSYLKTLMVCLFGPMEVVPIVR